jgi:flagellar P-ring protein precursor FlgI
MTYLLGKIVFLFYFFLWSSFSMIAAENTANKNVEKEQALQKFVRTTQSDQNSYFSKIRIKDLATFEGIRDNQLIGYGLVVGLNGSGDTLSSSPYTNESLVSMLERLGVNVRDGKVPSGKNVAAVMITANLPPFARHGTKIDVAVSSLGDAQNLRGGVLLVTPLYGADGEVYAVAQGNVSVSGLTAAGENAVITKGVPTAGLITNGAIIEKEIGFDFEKMPSVNLSLRNPDFTTAERMAFKINNYFNEELSRPTDPSTVNIVIPAKFKKQIVRFMTEIEQLRIRPDQTAKVVIDDTNGVIVVGKDVRINPVAITQGNITVTISEEPIVSQPNTQGATFNNPVNLVAQDNFSASLTQLQLAQIGLVQKKLEEKKQTVNADNALNDDEKKSSNFKVGERNDERVIRP